MLQGVLLCIIPMLDPSAVPNDCEFLPVCESDLPGNFVLFAQMAPLDFDSTCLYFSIMSFSYKSKTTFIMRKCLFSWLPSQV